MSVEREWQAIEEVAADWLVERDCGLTPERARELDAWLSADARHAEVFRALDETWDLIGAAPRRGEDVEVEVGLRRTGSRRMLGVVGLAAGLVVAFLGWQQFGQRAVEARAGEVFAMTAETEVGVLRTLALPDGSAVQLNTDSALEVRFERGVRRVRLTRGEAHFSVAKDAGRPFLVQAGGVDVRVVGTVFNVRLRPEAVDVLVTEGKVRVAPHDQARADERSAVPAKPAELTAGQKVSVALRETATPVGGVAEPVSVTTAEIRQALAWQTRRLDFDATPLSEIVAEVNRYNEHKLIIDDPRLNERRFGGSFPASDHATLVRMLEADFGVVAERRAKVTVLRLKAP